MAKAITGTLAARLARRGVVDLEAPIGPRIGDGLSNDLSQVTLAHLLSHTGGVRHYRGGEWAKISQAHCRTAAEGIEPFRLDPPIAPPGAAFTYSSFGFVLASAVLEAEAGLPFSELVRREIFEPAGMEDTVVDSPPYGLDRAATFYRPALFGRVQWARPWDNSCKAGAGGFLSSTEDMARFGMALLGGELVDEVGRDLLFQTRQSEEDGPLGYSLGWVLAQDDAGRLDFAGHSGGSPGGRSYLLVDPNHDLVVALAGNLEGERFSEEVRTIRDLFLAQR